MIPTICPQRGFSRSRRAFSLAELLIVCGIIALLVSLLLPPLRLARSQAQRTRCAAQQQQIGRALDQAFTDHGYYPLADDGGAPTRYTWIDVLVQRRYLGAGEGRRSGSEPTPQERAVTAEDIGYCPSDALPDPLNVARHPDLIYPRTGQRGGVDYSYGIGIPLSSGGWHWRPATLSDESRPRRFRDYDRGTSSRVLAADAYTTGIYNLSGQAVETFVWNQPTQYDNTVAWGRHGAISATVYTANALFQDGHVAAVRYDSSRPDAVNTSAVYVWQPGESLLTNPADRMGDQWYPNQPPPSFQSSPRGAIYPDELVPRWYTENNNWTLISHK